MFNTGITNRHPAVFILLLPVFLFMSAFMAQGADPIDWKQRFDYWTARYQPRFQPPTPGKAITITLKNGKETTGTLTAVHTNSIIIRNNHAQEETCPRTSISRDDRMKLFRDDFARANALQQVLQEKQSHTDQPPVPSPQTIQTQARLLTEVQFAEYTAALTGLLARFYGTVSDVQLNFFSEYQCYLQLTDDNEKPVVATFTANTPNALNLNKNEPLSIIGIIKSVRLYNAEIRITLNDVSPDITAQKQEPSTDE